MVKTHSKPQPASTPPDPLAWIDRKVVRNALKSWSSALRLSASPLAGLRIVAARRQAAGYPDTPTGSGEALRAVLQEAIESLRPDDDSPNPLEKRWRPFLIIQGQYWRRQYPSLLAGELGLGLDAYYHEQMIALDHLADTLRQWETHSECVTPAAPLPPFLAPRRPDHPLVGRDDLLQTLKRQLFAGNSLALFALKGLPGVGKTALAIALANDPDVLAHFQDGVLWARLGRQPNLLAILGEWAAAVGIPSERLTQLTTIAAMTDAIHAAIGLRRLLLVADDAWDAGAALTFKLGGPNCAHIVTTRLATVAVHFTSNGVTTVPELNAADSLDLLAQLAPEAVAHNPTVAAAVAQATGGLPLSLLLIGNALQVAAYEGKSMPALLEELSRVEARLRLTRPLSPPERYPGLPVGAAISLETAISISEAMLSESARLAFHALAVLPHKPNTFSRQAALAVAGQPATALDALVSAGLVEESGPERYTLHQAIAEYARCQLTDTAAWGRLVTFFVDDLLGNRDQGESDYPRLDADATNLFAALQAAHEHEMPAALVRGANRLYDYLDSRGLYTLAETHLQRALAAAQSLADSKGQVTTLLHLAAIAHTRGDNAQAEQYCQEALPLARQREDKDSISALLYYLGQVAHQRGDYEKAEALWGESLSLARQVSNARWTSDLLAAWGWQVMSQGRYEQAEQLYQEGLTLARQSGREAMVSMFLCFLGRVARQRGDYVAAKRLYEESLAIGRRIGHRDRICQALSGLGLLAINQGNDQWGESRLLESLSIARDMGYTLRISDLLINLGHLEIGRRNYQKAEGYLQEGWALVRQIGHNENSIYFLEALALVAAGQGDDTRAETYLQDGLAYARRAGHRERTPAMLIHLGDIASRRGDDRQAEALYRESLTVAREIGYRHQAAVALYNLARLAAGRGDRVAAYHQAQESLAILQAIGHTQAQEVAAWLAGLRWSPS